MDRTREAAAQFAIAEWTDRGDEMSSAEFRRCMELVLPYSDEEATTIFNSATAEQQRGLPWVLIPHGCGAVRLVRCIEESRDIGAMGIG
jgi:hypothetical protein